MRAIVRNTARGAALVCIAAVFAAADAHDDVMDLLASAAGALSEIREGVASRSVNVSRFMSAFSKDMPDRDTLENNVTALANSADVSSSITPLTEDGDEQARKMDLDWLLEIRSLEQDGPLVRRREVVHCELRKEKKGWKIVVLKPIDFFAPPNLGK
jgi:hypothetical protein